MGKNTQALSVLKSQVFVTKGSIFRHVDLKAKTYVQSPSMGNKSYNTHESGRCVDVDHGCLCVEETHDASVVVPLEKGFDNLGKVNGNEIVNIVESLLISNPNVELKLIPVPCKLRNNFSNWQRELVNDFDREFLLNGVLEGFHILENKTPEFEADMTNYESASVHCRKAVENQINVEINAGNYVKGH